MSNNIDIDTINYLKINCKKINNYYIDFVCKEDVKELIKMNIINNENPETVCYITTATLVWLFTGNDIVSPFSGLWEKGYKSYDDAKKNYGSIKYCAIAINRINDIIEDEDDFEDMFEHSFIYINNENIGEFILDSNWSEKRELTYTKCNSIEDTINNFQNNFNYNDDVKYDYRYIPFEISFDFKIRLDKIL